MNPLQQKIRDEFREHMKGREGNFMPLLFEEDLAFLDKIPALVIEEAERVVRATELKASHTIKPEVVEFYDGAVEETKRVILQALSTLK